MNLKLSICILTHNRPILFKRCINSILNNLPTYNIEILVNNDSNDIQEIFSDKINIKYFYKKNNDLSKIYKLLFDKSSGDFIYFLEDDDYLHNIFFNYIDFKFDINYFLYTSKDHIAHYGISQAINLQNLNKHLLKEVSFNKFITHYDDTYFQLSQILFRKNIVSKFPKGNNIKNDYKLFKSCKNSTIKYIDKQLWVQTTDGKDNISFDNLNKDKRFNPI